MKIVKILPALFFNNETQKYEVREFSLPYVGGEKGFNPKMDRIPKSGFVGIEAEFCEMPCKDDGGKNFRGSVVIVRGVEIDNNNTLTASELIETHRKFI